MTMTVLLKSLVISLALTVHLVQSATALRRRGSVVRYDARSDDDDDVVFTSAALDQRTGALYVVSAADRGATSSLRRFTASLRPEAEYPLAPSSDCEADRNANATDRAANGTGGGVVRLDPVCGLVLACAGPCGHCSVLDTTDDGDDGGGRPQALDPSSRSSYVAARDAGAPPAIVFAAENASLAAAEGRNGTAAASRLFVAGSTASELEAVSVRALSAAGGLRTVGARHFAGEARYRFVDALDPGDGFVYLVAVGRTTAETRLVRVCRDDAGRLDSYVEIRLSCTTGLNEPLDVPVTARVAPVGAELAGRRPSLAVGEPAIYLVAERPGPAEPKDAGRRRMSGICVYPMRLVRKHHSVFRFKSWFTVNRVIGICDG